MKNIISKLLEYIYNVNNKNIKLENIYIFVNEYTKNNIGIIEMLARKCKTVNIVTENLKYFIKLEDFLYNEGLQQLHCYQVHPVYPTHHKVFGLYLRLFFDVFLLLVFSLNHLV